ncbi:hypothetical protein CBM2589_U10171 [Cupriavidus taiwanensis]|uniref:Uncharacterized protein n=1 Tax=Cupriavidus taiwanensis TaxID=164546 RepID=A0A375CQG4_9BURK|nr:hypothetical protein CBM2589_U10171 [Cupriavidus taiwanensis]
MRSLRRRRYGPVCALLGGPEAERKTRTGDGTRRPPLRLFERVECDAHKLDARMVVLVGGGACSAGQSAARGSGFTRKLVARDLTYLMRTAPIPDNRYYQV